MGSLDYDFRWGACGTFKFPSDQKAKDERVLLCFADKSEKFCERYVMIKWGASSRWSFGPKSAWGSIETTIGKTHPTLLKSQSSYSNFFSYDGNNFFNHTNSIFGHRKTSLANYNGSPMARA